MRERHKHREKKKQEETWPGNDYATIEKEWHCPRLIFAHNARASRAGDVHHSLVHCK